MELPSETQVQPGGDAQELLENEKWGGPVDPTNPLN